MKTSVGVALFLVAGLLIAWCESKDTTIANPGISFKIKDFDLKYEESDCYKCYSGKGTIVAVGDPELVRKPYLVLLSYQKIKGRVATGDDNSIEAIEVLDAIGNLRTYDYADRKDDNVGFEKPEYRINVIGYIPLGTWYCL